MLQVFVFCLKTCILRELPTQTLHKQKSHTLSVSLTHSFLVKTFQRATNWNRYAMLWYEEVQNNSFLRHNTETDDEQKKRNLKYKKQTIKHQWFDIRRYSIKYIFENLMLLNTFIICYFLTDVDDLSSPYKIAIQLFLHNIKAILLLFSLLRSYC